MPSTSRFHASVLAIPAPIRDEMRGRSWRDDPRCPPFEALRLLRLLHHGFDGHTHEGELVVSASIADVTVDVFGRLFALGFPIASMRRVDAFGGDDDRSMAANNTSAFNFRTIPGSDRLSHHALGVAIDVNPLHNPMILDGVVHPVDATDYVDRSRARPGMFLRPGAALEAFESRGFEWGGDWSDLPDFHHFSRLRRGA